ncbi:DddA-like double-stranded DNA deaminase toxin [Actinoalloteichus hymeniacidonis]
MAAYRELILGELLPPLTEAASGSASPELHTAVALLHEVAEDLARAWTRLEAAGHHAESYAQSVLGSDPAAPQAIIPTTDPATGAPAPRPSPKAPEQPASTTPARELTEQESADWAARQRVRLPPRVQGSKTTGRYRDASGEEYEIVSGADAECDRVNEHFRDHGPIPQSKLPNSLSRHVEIKTAYRMVEEGCSRADLVINHRMCARALYNCERIVPRILYVEQILIIHDPVKTHVIKGRRTR